MTPSMMFPGDPLDCATLVSTITLSATKPRQAAFRLAVELAGWFILGAVLACRFPVIVMFAELATSAHTVQAFHVWIAVPFCKLSARVPERLMLPVSKMTPSGKPV